jgi:hypothetical protein
MILAVSVGGLSWAFWPKDEADATQPTGSVDAADGDPMVAIPEPTAKPQTLHLELALPPLSDEQLAWQRAAEAVTICPLCKGIVDQPPIPFTDDERNVFIALLYTESNLRPYNEAGDLLTSEAGCKGIAQLCGHLLTFETADNQMWAIYVAADYFKDLLNQSNGDYLMALKSYKGSTDDSTTYQADRTFDYLRLRAGR